MKLNTVSAFLCLRNVGIEAKHFLRKIDVKRSSDFFRELFRCSCAMLQCHISSVEQRAFYILKSFSVKEIGERVWRANLAKPYVL